MMDAFERLLNQARKTEPTVQGQWSLNWGAQTLHSRTQIRTAISNALQDLGDADIQALENLGETPHLHDWSVSISHTHNAGGWFAAHRPTQIGWDVERCERIKPVILQRVCTEDEMTAAPESAFLWCAKESFFKALEDFQPVAIPQLTISDWHRVEQNLWSWRGFGPRNGTGFLVAQDEWLLAVSLVVPE